MAKSCASYGTSSATAPSTSTDCGSDPAVNIGRPSNHFQSEIGSINLEMSSSALANLVVCQFSVGTDFLCVGVCVCDLHRTRSDDQERHQHHHTGTVHVVDVLLAQPLVRCVVSFGFLLLVLLFFVLLTAVLRQLCPSWAPASATTSPSSRGIASAGAANPTAST